MADLRPRWVAYALGLVASACGGGGGSTSPDAPVGPTCTGAEACGAADGCCPGACTPAEDTDCTETDTALIPPDRRIDWTPGVPGGIPMYPVGITATDPPYGATHDGSTDDTSAIQDALDACATDTAVFLPAGTYKISADLRVPSHCALRGAGAGQTILRSDSGGYSIIGIGDSGSAWNAYHEELWDPWVALTADGAKDATTITVADASAFDPGDLVLIDEVNDDDLISAMGQEGLCNYCDRGDGTRSVGQLARVESVAGNVVTLDRPLYWTFRTSRSAQANPMDTDYLTEWAGIEDLTITQPAPTSMYSVHISGAVYSWLRGVEIENIDWRAVWTFWSLGLEIRDSYVHTGINEYGHSHGYGVTLSLATTASLVENNVFDHLCYATVVFGGATGNVIAYNYSGTTDYSFSPDWLVAPWGSHGAHPMMNLWEGNAGAKVYYDFIHGSASHETFYRNAIRGAQPDRVDANIAIGFEEYNTTMNVVGNVLGTAGVSEVYEQNASSQYDTWMKTIFWLGAPSADGRPEATILRAANYDHIHACAWDDAAGRCLDAGELGLLDLPPSLYLTAKPAWFGAAAWPPYGPDVAGLTTETPAEARFHLLTGN